jgi:hypothetical protein
LTGVTLTDASPATLVDAARAHRERWIAARCGDRAVLRLDCEPEPPRAVHRAVADAAPGVVAWLDGMTTAGPGAALADELVTAVRRGWGVALAIPACGAEPPTTPVPAPEEPEAIAAALAERLGNAEVIPQRLAEASIITSEPGPLTGSLDDLDPAPSDVHAWLVLAGLPEVASGTFALSAGTLHRTYLLWLDAANAELRRANVRLAREHLGQYDAAAASTVHRIALAEETAARAEAERDAALERLAAERSAAAAERSAAAKYYEITQAKWREPHLRIAEGIVRRARRVPGASRAGGAVARRMLPPR